MTITVISKFQIIAGREETILDHMRGYAKWLRENEPQTLRWDIYQSEEPGIYICVEEFFDDEAREKHVASAAVYFGERRREISVYSEIVQQYQTRQLISAW